MEIETLGMGISALFILLAFISLIAALYLNFRKRRLRSEEIIAAIEKGVEVPFPPYRERNYRNLGIIWTAAGIALLVALWVSAHIEAAVWGLLPVGLGVAFLLIAREQKLPEEAEQS